MVITDMSELGSLIRTARREQGLTQTELAGLAGVGVTFVSQLENGKQSAEAGKVIDVLLTLGIDLIAERRA
ncbi:type II toxin-antitoxin system Y4mF family antitoxin [[Collinsella] massiliensis]|uniref:Transcriptional regulator n=1 Tax=[Collinsella] massiliensis TaxID=1232426 RepID=A0A1Y3XVQ3_9ACTN|nr:type II toxin-antitoxin system Y4mF family antitoxin [[Collinsella] massiliensis]OUN89644.1 transcriptional regulator [[Collinsella] massiliensis]